MFLLTFVIFLTIYCQNTQCQTCTSLDNLRGTVNGKRVENRGIISFTSITYMKCGIECLKRKVCVSFNYDLYNQTCMLTYGDLNNEDNMQPDSSYIVSSIADFPRHLAGNCENHDCPTSTECVDKDYDSTPGSTNNNPYSCKHFGCPVPPAVNNATFLGTGSLTYGSEALYKCDENYEPFNNSTCNIDGSWTEFKCKRRVRNCTELKSCLTSPKDEEYWLYPVKFGDKRIKIYCENMQIDQSTPNSPKSYVTLSEKTNNTLKNQCSGTQTISYKRLGVDLQTMIIHPNDTEMYDDIFNDFPPLYGSVHNCPYGYSYTCSVHLLINTTGTGLLINKTAEWVILPNNTSLYSSDKTFNSVINYVNKSSDYRVINISCSGHCGGCRPENDLSFEYDENYEINITDAIDPVCFN